MKYRVMVTRYGYATVEADSESEACEKADELKNSDFDWSDPDDAQVVEEIDYE